MKKRGDSKITGLMTGRMQRAAFNRVTNANVWIQKHLRMKMAKI